MFSWGDYCRCSNSEDCALKSRCLRATPVDWATWVSFSDFYKEGETCGFFIDLAKFN